MTWKLHLLGMVIIDGYARTSHDTGVIWYDMNTKLNMDVQEFSFSWYRHYCFKSLRVIWPKVEVIDTFRTQYHKKTVVGLLSYTKTVHPHPAESCILHLSGEHTKFWRLFPTDDRPKLGIIRGVVVLVQYMMSPLPPKALCITRALWSCHCVTYLDLRLLNYHFNLRLLPEPCTSAVIGGSDSAYGTGPQIEVDAKNDEV